MTSSKTKKPKPSKAFNKIKTGLDEALEVAKKPELTKEDFDLGFNRNFTADPYDRSEKRVAQWLHEVGGVGGGEDPVGFMMASYVFLVDERKELKRHVAALQLDNDRLSSIKKFDDNREPPTLDEASDNLYAATQEFVARLKDDNNV